MHTGWIGMISGGAALPPAGAEIMGSRDKPGYDDHEYIQCENEAGVPDSLLPGTAGHLTPKPPPSRRTPRTAPQFR